MRLATSDGVTAFRHLWDSERTEKTAKLPRKEIGPVAERR